MNDFEITDCLVCRSNEYFPYSSKGQFGITCNVVICKNCGFSYLNPRWTKERYHKFYTKEYDTYYRPEVISKNYAYDSAISIKNILSRSENLLDFKKENVSVLDVGTGMGDSLLYLKNHINPKGSYYAIESSEHCIANLTRNGITLITNDVDTDWHTDQKEKFDIIIMRHVLEHFLNPSDVLKKINYILKPNGILYLAVPNAKKPGKLLLTYFFRVVHVSYFSKLSLNNLFALCGFKSIEMVEGDAFDKHEIFTFCKKTLPSPITIVKGEWIVQKNIYDAQKKFELYYRFKNFIAKKIILRFR